MILEMIVINSDYFKIELIINKKAHLFNPYKIITFDTEAKRYKTNYGEKHIFFNLDLFDGKEHYYTENKNEIIDLFYLLIKKYKRLSFFAHNITYDIRILDLLIKLLNDKFIDYFNKIRVLDKVFYVKFTSRKRDYVINFIDSMNYFKTSLSRLSNNYGVKKVNEDEYKLEPKEWNKQLLIDGKERVMKDTEILYTVLESFFNMPFKFGITLASTSFNTYKINFIPTKISFPISLSKYALESYKGGIVLPYKLTRNKYLRDYDINSLYPKVMRDNLYSYKFKKELNNFKYIYDDIKNKSYNYLVYCSWSGKGYSPVYVKYDNQLIPFLNASGWITGNELLALYENDFNIMLYKIYEFYNTDLFSNFIETYYDLRKNTTKEYERDFYKLIMNSLYGKFGQNKGHSELILIDDIENKMIKEVIKESDSEKIIINGKTYSIYDNFVSVRTDNEVKYNPLIASEITANARLLNFTYSKIIGFNNLYYTDTDSFFTDKKLDSFIGKELGQMKLEREGIFTIHAPKDYEFYGKCNKKDCKICKDEDGLHYTIKGVNTDVYGNTYVSRKWSGLKYKINNNMYIEEKTQYLNRINKKMKYIKGIGYEWNDYNEYNKHTMRNIKYEEKDIEKIINTTIK